MTNNTHSVRMHSLVGASSAYRWTRCAGSVGMELRIENIPTSAAAEEGTTAHELSELILIPLVDGASWEQALNFLTREKYDDEMLEYVESYCRYVWEEIQRHKPKKVLIEESLCLDSDIGMFGTADVMYAYRGPNGEKIGRIIDLKYGRGLYVEAEGNPQLAYYGCAMQAKYGVKQKFDRVDVTIFQPRIECGAGPARTWSLDAEDLERWTAELKTAGRRAVELSAYEPEELGEHLVAGEHCRFCAAQAICSAYAGKVAEETLLDFSDEAIAELAERLPTEAAGVVVLEDEQVSRILRAKDKIKQFLTAVESYAIARCAGKDPIAGWKLVSTTPRRKWGEESEVVAGLRALGLSDADIFVSKLRTLSEIERKAGKGKINHLCGKTKPSVTIVPESDARPHYDPDVAAASDFPDAVD